MKSFIALFSVVTIFLSCAVSDKKKQFEWHVSSLGGGGFIDGIIQNPQDPNIIYIRGDVPGEYHFQAGTPCRGST